MDDNILINNINKLVIISINIRERINQTRPLKNADASDKILIIIADASRTRLKIYTPHINYVNIHNIQ